MTLEERFTDFVRNLQSAELVDELELSPEQKRAKKPDFFFFERQFIGEMKDGRALLIMVKRIGTSIPN